MTRDTVRRLGAGERQYRALDLFCGAGGVTKGLQNAGFYVVGVDIKKQPRYCGDEFIQGDALNSGLDLPSFDFIWASPPCQAHTSLKTMYNAKKHEDLIPATRAILKAAGTPYAIENVMGAALISPVILCGTMFGLGVDDAELRRHRQFETSFPLLAPKCQHGAPVIGVCGGHARNRKRTIGVYGEGARDSRRKFDKGHPDFSVHDARIAMGIDWMTIAELSQAIPPAYSEYIGNAALQHIRQRSAA